MYSLELWRTAEQYSVRPNVVYDYIERMYPTLLKIELSTRNC